MQRALKCPSATSTQRCSFTHGDSEFQAFLGSASSSQGHWHISSQTESCHLQQMPFRGFKRTFYLVQNGNTLLPGLFNFPSSQCRGHLSPRAWEAEERPFPTCQNLGHNPAHPPVFSWSCFLAWSL